MSRPKVYDPQDGYTYQILCRNQQYSGREWEHCDYAVDRADRRHLLDNYRLAYGAGWEFKTIFLPAKYWPKRKPVGIAPTPQQAEVMPNLGFEPLRNLGVMVVCRRQLPVDDELTKPFVVVNESTGRQLEEFNQQKDAEEWAEKNQGG